MSWKASRPVAVPRTPHLSIRSSTTSNPGMSGETRKAVTFVSSLPSTGVRAMTVNACAIPPLVIHLFCPLSRYPVPSSLGVAIVCTFPASLPASGSVKAKALIHSPVASLGSHCFCCSSLPKRTMALGPMEWCALTNSDVLPQCPANRSTNRQYWV